MQSPPVLTHSTWRKPPERASLRGLITKRPNDLGYCYTDCPEVTPAQFAKAVVRHGLPENKNKAQVTLRIDHEVLEWFKSQGKGYQTQINSLLRAYMEAHE